jgi:hypothetical protein
VSGNVAHTKWKRDAYKIFVGKPEEKYHLEGWEAILQMDQDDK